MARPQPPYDDQYGQQQQHDSYYQDDYPQGQHPAGQPAQGRSQQAAHYDDNAGDGYYDEKCVCSNKLTGNRS